MTEMTGHVRRNTQHRDSEASLRLEKVPGIRPLASSNNTADGVCVGREGRQAMNEFAIPYAGPLHQFVGAAAGGLFMALHTKIRARSKRSLSNLHTGCTPP